jgi:hypothetical protein
MGAVPTYIQHWVYKFRISVGDKEPGLTLAGVRHVSVNRTFDAVPFGVSAEPDSSNLPPTSDWIEPGMVYFLSPEEAESLDLQQTRGTSTPLSDQDSERPSSYDPDDLKLTEIII